MTHLLIRLGSSRVNYHDTVISHRHEPNYCARTIVISHKQDPIRIRQAEPRLSAHTNFVNYDMDT